VVAHRDVGQNQMVEWAYRSTRPYADPFNEVDLDVLVTDPQGRTRVVPAFWAGEGVWRVRYASSAPGQHRCVSRCSDAANSGLHEQQDVVEVHPYTGQHPLYGHGPLRVASDRRHLEHHDGTPFFWLADTWWMALCRRLSWPHDFQRLTADRVAKGYSVIQIVAGLYPDMPAFDPRGANEAGFPWTPDYTRINPAYFDAADLRLAWLVEAGLIPCVVGCWGYYARWMGVPRMKQHWRYLVARYGAYPVVWCLAGEAIMPYYLSPDKEGDRAWQRHAWTELATYVRETDPYQHPLTIHPTDAARHQVEDASLLDIDLLQTGHSDRQSFGPTVHAVAQAVATAPPLPVINAEVCYEGILEANRQEVQRLMFWTCLLSGAAGHTYGANGIWQVNSRQDPYGPSPHGLSWGDTPWDEAAQLPGGAQVALGKRLLQRYRWWRFAPHPEWISVPTGGQDALLRPYAAGIPAETRVIYFPWAGGGWWFSAQSATVGCLEPDITYHAFFFNPVTGQDCPLGEVQADASGRWPVPNPTVMHDWVLVLERAGGSAP